MEEYPNVDKAIGTIYIFHIVNKTFGLPTSGLLIGWNAYSPNNISFHLQIWRPLPSGGFKLISSTEIKVSEIINMIMFDNVAMIFVLLDFGNSLDLN